MANDDIDGFGQRIQLELRAFGFSNVTTACLTPDPANPASGGTPCAATQALQDQYLFWDNLHPTERAHQIIAAQALTQLP